jgi:hypothetical protein
VVALLRLGQTNEAFAIADAARWRRPAQHIAAAGRDCANPGAAPISCAPSRLLRRIDQLVDRLRVADTRRHVDGPSRG